jgi:hypothetical protein
MNSRPDPTNNPLMKAFFLGRAVAELARENFEKTTTDLLSELGKFDAEQRVNLRHFVEQVNTRADQAMASAPSRDAASGQPAAATGMGSSDLQATIDNLRAEIAAVRNELQRYRKQP